MNIETRIANALEQHETLILATIIHRTGSAPRHPGARMLVFHDLSVFGSVGGGLVEAETLAAMIALRHAQSHTTAANTTTDANNTTDARLLRFDMTNPAPDADLICGGIIDILVEQLSHSQLDLWRKAAQCREMAAFGVWTLDLHEPSLTHNLTPNLQPLPISIQRHFHTDPTPLPFPVLEQFRTDTAACIELKDHSKSHRVYVEPLLHQGVVVLCGGGHIALAVGALAAQTGFEVVVVDDRPEFASIERFPLARAVHVLPGFSNLAVACGIGPQHFIVIATRGHAHDRDCLAQAIRTPARYIGMIGSKQKRDSIYAFLKDLHFTDYNRIHSPIGLDIGADSPEEIAVSILAELIAVRHGKK